MKVSAFFGLIAFAPLLSCVAEDADRLVQQESSLTAEDSDVGTLLGKVGVCHYDVVKGYVYLRLATKACQHGHALHDLDFASDDPACIPPQPTCESGSDSDCPAGMYCETASGDCIQSLACKLTSWPRASMRA